MVVYTVVQAAQIIKLAPRTVRKWCVILDVRKWGRDYVLLPEDVANIRIHAQKRPGRPVKKV